MQTGEARAREAALLLHGLGPKQRDTVLARLDPGHVATLRPLLDELAALGIPPSLAQASAGAGGAGALHARRGVEPAASEAMTLEPQRAGRALRACAAPTVAALLRDAPSAWREVVLAELPRDRRRDVIERLDQAPPPLPPRVMHALHRRLREETTDAVGAGRTATLPRLGGWKRWLRWSR